jgi:hypothetical protein
MSEQLLYSLLHFLVKNLDWLQSPIYDAARGYSSENINHQYKA